MTSRSRDCSLPRRRSALATLGVAGALVVAQACGGSSPPALDGSDGSAGDAAGDGADTSVVDTGAADTHASDSAVDSAAQDSGAPNDAGVDSGTTADTGIIDSGPHGDGGFVEGTHTLTPIPDNGGPVIASPELVTITYADDVHRATEETLGAFLVQSQWLATVGQEYGVHGHGTSANAEMAQNAPMTIDDTAIQSLIASLITAGTAPDPIADAGASVAVSPAVYMIYIPSSTTVTVSGSTLCQISGGGYHYESSVNANGHTFAYAVVSECAGGLAYPQDLGFIASHELIEACTDPLYVTAPAYTLSDPSQPWSVFGGEVGDLCSYLDPQWTEGTWTSLQRVYSNASIAAGGAPCIPVPQPYYGTDVEPSTYVALPAGQSTTYQVRGWSTSAVAAWPVQAVPYPLNGATAMPTMTLGTGTMTNGGSTTMTVTMPAGTASGTYVNLLVYSDRSTTDYSTTMVGVYVP